ncbi:MAG: CBS domain-containing protein [Planctomycetota bacterium]
MQTLTRAPRANLRRYQHDRNACPISSVTQELVMIHHYQQMTNATDQIVQAKKTCGVVVNGLHQCVGLLTQTDIQNYFQLWIRYLDRDESVLPSIFETSAFGLLRIDREYFHQVGKHMTSPVVTIPYTSSCGDAIGTFEQNSGIHQLVVLGKRSKPIGVVSKKDLLIDVE